MLETCKRCNYSWNPRSDTPLRCPKCKSTRWNMEQMSRKCLRCGETWLQRGDSVPRYCPACHSSNWNTPRTEFTCPKCGKIRTLRANSRSDMCPYCDRYRGVVSEQSTGEQLRSVGRPVRIWTDGNGMVLMYMNDGTGGADLLKEGKVVASTNLDTWFRTHNYTPENVISGNVRGSIDDELKILAMQMYVDRLSYRSKAETICDLRSTPETESNILALYESGMSPVTISLKLGVIFSEVMSVVSNVPPMHAPQTLNKDNRVRMNNSATVGQDKAQKT